MALDVPRLLETSMPRSAGLRGALLLLPAIGLLAMVAAVALMLASSDGAAWAPLAALAALAISAGSMVTLSRLARAARDERTSVSQIDELIMLRHFAPAAGRLSSLLSRPMRLPQTRALALLHLARVLMRYERYEDAIEVGDAVINDAAAEPALRFAVACGRAMAMLRSGRLYDAGESMSQLRREVSRLESAVRRISEAASQERQAAAEELGPEAEDDPERSSPIDSAALNLVELYRDVQTRHSEEVLATLQAKGLALRDGLGARFGDVLALASVAAHRLADAERAARLWSDATCLVSESELRRRYPETAEVAMAYPATQRPPETQLNAGGGFA